MKPIPPFTGFYCWVRLVPLVEVAKIEAANVQLPPLSVIKPIKPQRAFVSDSLDVDGNNSTTPSSIPACFVMDMFAQKLQTDSAFELGPSAFTSKAKAEQWLRNTKAGQDWSDEGTNHALVGFGFDIQQSEADAPGIVTEQVKCSGTGVGCFPSSDWDADLKKEFEKTGNASVTILGRSITLPAPTLTLQDECKVLTQAIEQSPLNDAGKKQVLRQALPNLNIFVDIMAPLGLSTAKLAHGLNVADYTSNLIYDAIFAFKVHYNRARPWNCCEGVKPLIGKGTGLFPGHPGYPSGHATQAYTFAYLLASKFPEKEAALLAVAEQVATNRELAGLHFQSDSLSGQRLGEQFAAAILDAEPAHQDKSWSRLMEDLAKLV
jgi:PAP2 superfamily